MKARERQLREMIIATEKRMNRADISDNDFVRLGRMRQSMLADLDELKGSAPAATQRTGLSEFEKKLKERERQRAAASGGG